MKKSRFTEFEITSILKLKEAGRAVADLCCGNTMSQSSFYKLRVKYDGMDVYLIKRRIELEE